MVKKRVKSRKPHPEGQPTPSRASSSRGDRSRLDLKPSSGSHPAANKGWDRVKPATEMRAAESTDDTIARLQNALERFRTSATQRWIFHLVVCLCETVHSPDRQMGSQGRRAVVRVRRSPHLVV